MAGTVTHMVTIDSCDSVTGWTATLHNYQNSLGYTITFIYQFVFIYSP